MEFEPDLFLFWISVPCPSYTLVARNACGIGVSSKPIPMLSIALGHLMTKVLQLVSSLILTIGQPHKVTSESIIQTPECSEYHPSEQSPVVSVLCLTRLQLFGTDALFLSAILPLSALLNTKVYVK